MLVTRLFEHASDVRNVAAGETIFREGDERDYMYAVVEGEVDLSFAGKGLDTVGPGGLFGEMALIGKAPRIATAVARTNERIVPVEKLRRMDERFAKSS